MVPGLPVFPPGMMSCPAFDGWGMRLTSRATPAGPTLAVVAGDTAGCGSVVVAIGGKPMLTLAQATSMQQQIMTIAALRRPILSAR